MTYSWLAEFGESFARQRVLVTGATGFVGRYLCEALQSLGADVYALSRTASERTVVPGCMPWPVDLTDFDKTRSALSKVSAPLIFHLAGMTTARQETDLTLPMLRHNLISAVHLLLAVREVGCRRLVFVGSLKEPASQALEDAVDSPLAAAKASAAIYARMFHNLYGVPMVMPRPLLIYGPRQDPTKIVPYTILSLLRGDVPRLTSGRLVIDFVYVLDIVRGLLRAAIQPGAEGTSPDLGTGKGNTVRDVVEYVYQLMGSKERPVFGTLSDRVLERPHIADLEATRRILDWEPRWSLRQGLSETIDWYRLHWEGAVNDASR